jgi:uncharacterized protein
MLCRLPLRDAMKTSLDHLPLGKQRELEHIKTVLMEEFEKAIAGGDAEWRRNAKIFKIILFGSFARGDWVEDRLSGYKSDWDLLIVVSHEKLTDIVDYWWEAEEKLLRDPKVKRVVNIIVHSLGEVNQALGKGEYFWTDIERQGAMLFELPGYRLAAPMPLTPTDAYEMAKRYFDAKNPDIDRWLQNVEFQVAKSKEDAGFRRHAAFSLHQAVETAYACFLLVYTLYRPHSHNIKSLRSQSESRDNRLVPAWPRKTKKDESRFELLKRAYVEARYSERYQISAEELEILTGYARELRRIVEEVCQERLEELSEGR